MTAYEDLPHELREALGRLPEAEQWWDGLTPAAQRMALTWIGRAKSPQVREWRVQDVLRRARRFHRREGPFYPTREDQPLLSSRSVDSGDVCQRHREA